MELTGWSLADIDETDIESLIPFMFEYPRFKARQKTGGARKRERYADEVTWM